MKVLDLVKGKTAKFMYYRDGDLWYSISQDKAEYDGHTCKNYTLKETLFTFPVPISDTGSGIFENEMKAISLLRWINKHLATTKKWNSERSRIKEEAIQSKDAYFRHI